MNSKICCILNYAPHYRQAIYEQMDKELDCDFYFGDQLQNSIKKADIEKLKNATELKSIWFLNKAYWMKDSISLLFKPYKKYLLTGQIHCISNWVFFLLAKFLGKEIYLWNHGWYGKENRLEIATKKILFSSIKGFFLYGEYAKHLMINNGFNENSLHVIYNSLDYENTLQLRSRLSKKNIYTSEFKNAYPVIIFIGRLLSTKKIYMLISVIKSLSERKKLFNLVIVGDGPEKVRLEKMVMDYSISKNVWFYGSCYDESILSNLIFNADICISPGNVGLTAIHCLSYGTPVITHNNFKHQMPEFEAIIPGETGTFFNENDLDSLEDEIGKWMVRYPSKNEQLIQKCYHIIDEKYNPYYQIRVFKNIFSSNEAFPNKYDSKFREYRSHC